MVHVRICGSPGGAIPWGDLATRLLLPGENIEIHGRAYRVKLRDTAEFTWDSWSSDTVVLNHCGLSTTSISVARCSYFSRGDYSLLISPTSSHTELCCIAYALPRVYVHAR